MDEVGHGDALHMTIPKNKACVITLGCKVNQNESAHLIRRLEECGYQVSVGFPEEPTDLAVVNTCVVTGKAEAESRRAVKRLARTSPKAQIVVAGCYAELLPGEIAELPGVALVLGNTEKLQIHEWVKDLETSTEPSTHVGGIYSGLPPADLCSLPPSSRTRAFLRIQDGCQAFCSYCVVPKTRGPSRSLPPETVIRGIEGLAAQGVREVVLTGIHLGRYGKDLDPPLDLADLLELQTRPGDGPRIRLSSVEPLEVTDGLIELVSQRRNLVGHFHVPLQSGDPEILRKMNRHYGPAAYERVVRKIKKAMPGAAVGADVIVGFPGETDARFENTVNFIRGLPISYLHVFSYSKREGTPAANMPHQVPPREKKERSAVLRRLGHEKRAAFHRSWLGKESRLLVEERRNGPEMRLAGYTDEYVYVEIDGRDSLLNELVPVRILDVSRGGVWGRVLGG